MKTKIFSAFAIAAMLLSSCCQDETPRAKHVIFLGFDAMSAIGIQRAETPNFNYMIENGAISLKTRCVRETSSSQNWMCMVSGAPIEMTGITDNGWEKDNAMISPAVKNKVGIFPTVFDAIREQRPDARMEAYIEWGNETRMYDMSVFDKAVYTHGDEHYTGEEVMDAAFASYLENEPDFMFVSVDVTDHKGHECGHESQGFFDCIHHMDEKVGAFVKELEARGMMKDAVIIITADHGGINFGHGGDTMAELQIPEIVYGKGVTKGKVMEHANMIYDNAATIAGLLGVKLPEECRGKFMMQAFEPKTSVCYVPVPLVHPFKGVVADGEKVSITADVDGAEIYYTLDGSEPTKESIKYDGPFDIDGSVVIRSVAYKNGNYGETAINNLYTKAPEGLAVVKYRLHKNYMGTNVPDFDKNGRPDAEGYVSSFALEELPVTASEDHYAVQFSSNLKIDEDGVYYFKLSSDDGAKLIIDGAKVVDNDGSHSYNSSIGKASLTKGLHVIKVEYFEDTDGQDLLVEYSKDNVIYLPILSSMLER